MITIALESQHHEIISEFHKQKITALQNIHSLFSLCHGKITNYALRTAHARYSQLTQEDPGRCHNAMSKRTGIPCKHRIAKFLKAGKRMEPEEFHPQWHLKVWLFFCPVSEKTTHEI